MMIARLVVTLTVLVPLVAGCSASKDVAQGDEAVADSLRYGKAVYVLIDGRDAGTVPKTIRLYRSYGTREVSLFQRGKEIRKYEIGIAATAAGEQARMGFWSNRSAEGETYDVRTLPNKDEVYLIPFSEAPMRIEDHQYGLTMLIRQ
ncbi:MAG: hypothetical protein F4Y00_01080 [Bacteroidetes bacterium SB0662_bin_6]|nr:hypothetical protein [Bacteroidetes bacterium SB0668_bin_1]MYE03559.1 hypothetical protein [Bacteroidetes bacterium SB0662_bin_6]